MDPLKWSPRDGTREWSRLTRETPRDDLIDDRLAWVLFTVGSSALLAYQRAVDELSDRWLQRADRMAGIRPADAETLRELAREMRTALSGARLPHVPPGQRHNADAAADDPPCPACGSTEADCKPGCPEVPR